MKYKPLTLTPVNFSLTEGTSIPAPLDSPPATPRVPGAGQGPLSSHPTPKSAVFPHRAADADADAANAADAEQAPPELAGGSLSPTTSPSQRRPSSVRKFLGLRTLSSSDSLKDDRPSSPALTVSSQKQSLSRKKSTSWFGRRKSSAFGSVPEGKETKDTLDSASTSTSTSASAARLNGAAVSRPMSMMPSQLPQPAQSAQPPKPKGPPAPALPELKSFGVSGESLSFGGEDLFKDIK